MKWIGHHQKIKPVLSYKIKNKWVEIIRLIYDWTFTLKRWKRGYHRSNWSSNHGFLLGKLSCFFVFFCFHCCQSYQTCLIWFFAFEIYSRWFGLWRRHYSSWTLGQDLVTLFKVQGRCSSKREELYLWACGSRASSLLQAVVYVFGRTYQTMQFSCPIRSSLESDQ